MRACWALSPPQAGSYKASASVSSTARSGPEPLHIPPFLIPSPAQIWAHHTAAGHSVAQVRAILRPRYSENDLPDVGEDRAGPARRKSVFYERIEHPLLISLFASPRLICTVPCFIVERKPLPE